MKKTSPKPVVIILILSIFMQNQWNMSLCEEEATDYNVSSGDVFIWQFNDVDFVDNTYYIKFIINQIYANNSIIGQVEQYHPFLNVSTNGTALDTTLINPKEEIYILPAFDFFGLDFNQSIFVNTSQLKSYEQNEIQNDIIEIADQLIECYTLTTHGKEIWIDKTKGVIVKVDYVKVYTLELVSWEDVNLIEFAKEMHYENSINSIYYFLISAAVAGLIITTHLLFRRYKKKKFLKKKEL